MESDSRQETCAFCVRLRDLAILARQMEIEPSIDDPLLKAKINEHFLHAHFVELKPYYVER